MWSSCRAPVPAATAGSGLPGWTAAASVSGADPWMMRCMRFATFNLMHGRSLSDGRVDPDRLRQAVVDLDVDVLGMQEVDRDQPRSGGADLAALAAAALGERAAHRFAPAVIGTPGESFRAVTVA